MAQADAYSYGYELITTTSPLPSVDGISYGYEMVMESFDQSSNSAFAYGYELAVLQPGVGTRDTNVYGYENIASNSNPTQLKMWDGGQWIHKPYYVWNGSAWEQVT